MSGKSRQNEFEAACHIATTVKRQTAIDAQIPLSIVAGIPVSKQCYPYRGNSLIKIHSRHAQRPISQLIADSVKLTTLTVTQTVIESLVVKGKTI